jgi:hypothetical protein
MQPGAKQNLVRIDVPDSRNDLLMHQQGLEPSAPTPQHPGKIFP